METIGADDMQIPFLRILQPLSPQLLKTDSKFIKGASAGDIFNTVNWSVLGGRYWSDCTDVCIYYQVSGVPTPGVRWWIHG